MAEEYPSIHPRDMVLDCMRQAVSIQIMNAKEATLPRRATSPEAHIANQLQFLGSTTDQGCDVACGDVLSYAYRRYPSVFDAYVFMNTWKVEGYEYHTMFVLHAKNEDWYIGSPANSTEEQTFLTPIQAQTLESALEELNTQRNASWPDADGIRQFIHTDRLQGKPIYYAEHGYYVLPSIDVYPDKIITGIRRHYSTPAFPMPRK